MAGRFLDASAQVAEQFLKAVLLRRLRPVVLRPVLLVSDLLRHLERAGDRLGPVLAPLTCLDELYREHVLKEQPGPELVQIGSIAPAPAPKAKAAMEEREEVGSFGD